MPFTGSQRAEFALHPWNEGDEFNFESTWWIHYETPSASVIHRVVMDHDNWVLLHALDHDNREGWRVDAGHVPLRTPIQELFRWGGAFWYLGDDSLASRLRPGYQIESIRFPEIKGSILEIVHRQGHYHVAFEGNETRRYNPEPIWDFLQDWRPVGGRVQRPLPVPASPGPTLWERLKAD